LYEIFFNKIDLIAYLYINTTPVQNAS